MVNKTVLIYGSYTQYNLMNDPSDLNGCKNYIMQSINTKYPRLAPETRCQLLNLIKGYNKPLY